MDIFLVQFKTEKKFPDLILLQWWVEQKRLNLNLNLKFPIFDFKRGLPQNSTMYFPFLRMAAYFRKPLTLLKITILKSIKMIKKYVLICNMYWLFIDLTPSHPLVHSFILKHFRGPSQSILSSPNTSGAQPPTVSYFSSYFFWGLPTGHSNMSLDF